MQQHSSFFPLEHFRPLSLRFIIIADLSFFSISPSILLLRTDTHPQMQTGLPVGPKLARGPRIRRVCIALCVPLLYKLQLFNSRGGEGMADCHGALPSHCSCACGFLQETSSFTWPDNWFSKRLAPGLSFLCRRPRHQNWRGNPARQKAVASCISCLEGHLQATA